MDLGQYRPLWTEIDAQGREHPINFGATNINMNIYAGRSIKTSELFTTIVITPTEYGGAKLYVDGKLIKEI